MMFKRKKLLSVLLVFSLLFSIGIPSDLGISFASDTLCTFTFTYNNVSYKGVISVSSDEQISNNHLELTLLNRNSQTEICLPPFGDVYENIPKDFRQDLADTFSLSVESKDALQGAEKITISDGTYKNIPIGIFNGNDTIQEIHVTANNSSLILSKGCFANMSNLAKVKITCEDIAFQGNVFDSCISLGKVELNAEKGAYFTNGFNFSNCSQLYEVDFDCPTYFYNNGSADFTSSTFSKNRETYVNFQDLVTNTATAFDHVTLTAITFRGNDSTLSNGFITNSCIKDINIKANTTLGSKAICNSEIGHLNINSNTIFGIKAIYSDKSDNMVIDTLNLNSKTVFNNNAFCNAVINNFVFNVQNTNDQTMISYANTGARLGYCTKVKNMYFGTLPSDSADGTYKNCTQFSNFPLGNTVTTSLNIDNIYFVNPDFQYLGDLSYKRCDNKTMTNVYGYGGSTIQNEDGTYSSSNDMFEKWCAENYCVYQNCITTAEDLDYTINNLIYLPTDQTTIEYDFSSVQNLSVYATYLNNKTPYQEINNELNASGGKYQLHMSTDPTGSSNFAYRIYQLDPSITSGNAPAGTYTDDQKHFYSVLTQEKITLGKGTHDFLLEVGGVKHPIKLIVREKAITKISNITPANGETLSLKEGSELTPDMIKVFVTYEDDQKKEYQLKDNEFEIKNPLISAGVNEIEISTQISATQYATKTITVYGYTDNATGFDVNCKINSLSEGSTLTVNDVTLSNVTFSDPNRETVENVSSGFHFLVNGKETDEVLIQLGKNNISVTYEGYTKADAISITGTEKTIKHVKASLDSTAVIYENCSIPLSSLQVTAYYDDACTMPVDNIDPAQIRLGDYQISANQTSIIDVYYKDICADEPISVIGTADSITALSYACYKGKTEANTVLSKTDFSIQITMASKKVYDSDTYPTLLDHITLSYSTLKPGINHINVVYDDQFHYTVTIITSTTDYDTTPAPTATTATPTSTPTATPDYTPVVTATAAATATPTPDTIIDDPSVPLASGDQTQDTTTTIPTTVPTATTNTTTVPPAPTVAPNISTGKTYTVNNIKYKVLSFNGKSGTASIVGYVKSAKTITLNTNVQIKGCNFSIVSIQSKAFKNCSALKGSIKLIGSLKTVGTNAFADCKNLTSVVLGNNVTSLGTKCFYSCRKLKLVDLRSANKLRKVGSAAFKKNAKSRQFKISSGTKKHFAKLLKNKY